MGNTFVVLKSTQDVFVPDRPCVKILHNVLFFYLFLQCVLYQVVSVQHCETIRGRALRVCTGSYGTILIIIDTTLIKLLIQLATYVRLTKG